MRASSKDQETASRKLRHTDPLLPRSFRRELRFALYGLSAAVLVVLFLLYSLYDQRAERRAEVEKQIRDLACFAVQFAPPGNRTTDGLRVKYRCPPYHRAPAPKSSTPAVGGPTPGVGPTASRTVGEAASSSPSVTVAAPAPAATVSLGARPIARPPQTVPARSQQPPTRSQSLTRSPLLPVPTLLPSLPLCKTLGTC